MSLMKKNKLNIRKFNPNNLNVELETKTVIGLTAKPKVYVIRKDHNRHMSHNVITLGGRYDITFCDNCFLILSHLSV